jgi:hypothetical protein
MTHTLNRRGLSEERPGEEIVFLCMVYRKKKEQKVNDMRDMARTVLKYKPDNIIGAVLGLDEESIIQMAARTGVVTAVFCDKQRALKMIEEIKAQRLGISVVISALFKDVSEICKNVGLVEHTHNISLGVFGRTDKLPDEKTLEIATQCGHALVSPNLIHHVVKKIKKGKMTSAEAVVLLTKPCVCGVVNPDRTKRLLAEMVNAE